MKRALLALALAGCASAPAPERCEIELRSRKDRVERHVTIEPDGRATLVVTFFLGYVPQKAPPIEFRVDAQRCRALVRELPRAEHVAIGNIGADVVVSVAGAPVHESYGSRAPALLGLCALFAAQVDRQHFAEVLSAPERSGASWRITRDGDALPALRAALCAESPDPDVERLAAPIAIERRAFALVPELRERFLGSRTRDPNGDYYHALVLLRLGDPVGVDAVLRIALTPKPDVAMPAAIAINASFAGLFGKEPIPPYDFRSPDDPRPAAAQEFARFLAARGVKLAFDREQLVYR